MGRYSVALAEAVADAAGVKAGMRVLDVGCGPGALTAALVARAGPGAVAAVEPSDAFAAACAERVPGAEVEVASAEALPFADAAFDAVVSQLVVNFLDDAPAGVAEMLRVLRPGGTVAAAVWDYAGEMTLLRHFWDAAIAVDPQAAARDEGRVMPYCTPTALAALFTGLARAEVTPLEVSADYEGFDDLWAAFETGVGPSGAYAASLPVDRRAALREDLRARLGNPRAPFTLGARAWLLLGSM